MLFGKKGVLKMISLTVEIACGSDIRKACEEGITLANHLNILIKFDFNDVFIFAYPNSNIDLLIASYKEEVRSDSKYKIACGLE